MTPLTQDPTVIIFVKDHEIISVATNVSSELKVEIEENPTRFKEAANGMPFVDNPELK